MDDKISWKIIEKYFESNPEYLTMHHLNSFNDFVDNGIPRIFRDNNPIKIMKEQDEKTKEFQLQANLYLGGKDGKKIYYGVPTIYEDDGRHHTLYPNEARLRNMTYAFSIHVDVDVVFKIANANGVLEESMYTIEKVYMGKFPIMLNSKMCILHGLSSDARFNMGECRNDPGGYFIIDGKEKAVICQEIFANNMLNIKDSVNDIYSHAVEMRTKSEDPSKPVRTLSVRMVTPTKTLKNGQIVVNIPNVKKPVPLFIVMRALGVLSDKEIIQTCLLDLETYDNYVDDFISSVYDAGQIYSQESALQYISSFTKTKTIPNTQHILMDFFLPNIGELNFKNKAFFLGYMVKQMLNVVHGVSLPTDRDSFKFKRVELSGKLYFDLFLEYYKLQIKDIYTKIDSKYYYHKGTYQDNFEALINTNEQEYFSKRILEDGVRKAFKGNWGSEAHTKRPGVVQTLNRLSYFSFISNLRKINLPLDASAKVIGPRLLHSTQWGIICPVETPDGGNIGLHKHLSISANITSGCSADDTINWFKKRDFKLLDECNFDELHGHVKLFINGTWIGVVIDPISIVEEFKLHRRNGLIPTYNSIHWDIQNREIIVFTDDGRLMRPIMYLENGIPSINSSKYVDKKLDVDWEQMTAGFSSKKIKYSKNVCRVYSPKDLYDVSRENKDKYLNDNKGVIDYMDTMEAEGAYISTSIENLSKRHTHMEIHPSFILGVMGNMIVFPENNQFPRDLFSCGQSKQAVSIYHSNFQNRIDKMGVVLNYGQIPLVKSRYLDVVTKEQHPYGENAIVAIMSYNGYNVEDALIFNEASLKRGLFRTTYFSMYEAHEESENVGGGLIDTRFANINDKNVVGLKPGYDYNYLDKYGLIKENTPLTDKKIVIGKCTNSMINPGSFVDSSIAPKKGQLGYVDRAFMTEGEEGKRIAKIRIREERIPSIGDKLCSRAGQKGTIGIVLPEEDMPFNEDGIRPDLIVNPHALPSRMTIGQLVESIMGKACVQYGGFGDCTAFMNKGPKDKLFGKMLRESGFHSSGNEILYNGMTGEQMESDIYFGPTYYLRLKHMVKDKINHRARGPRTQLTRQTVGGRANDGGLRIGEMERDGVIAHGMTHFLQESMLVRGDDYYMAVCNNTGTVAIYNKSKNIFLSPLADGPLKFNKSLDGTMNIENISHYGRSFSIVRVPYAFKLLLQELQSMNIQMRIITEDNIDQLTSLTNDPKQVLLNTGEETYADVITNYKKITDSNSNIPDVKTYVPREIEPVQYDIQPGDYGGYGNVGQAGDYTGYGATSPPLYGNSPAAKRIISIIVPFRDQPKLHGIDGQDRRIHKQQFTDHMTNVFIPALINYSTDTYNIELDVTVIIVEQSFDSKKFNRGSLLNSGFIHIVKNMNRYGKHLDDIILHDIDLLPQTNMLDYYARPLEGEFKVRHLAHKWGRYKDIGFSYLGGITMFNADYFKKLNGFPTFFEGWGGEDDALRNRIKFIEGLNNADSDLQQVVEYINDIPEDGLIDLENLSNFKDKREIIKSDDEFDNKIKFEAIELDEKVYKVNGIDNPEIYGNLYNTMTETVENNITIHTVILNENLTSYDFIKNKHDDGSIYTNNLDILTLIERPQTPQGVSPAYQPTSPPFQVTSPAYQPNTPQGVSPTSPPFQVTSPAYQPNTPQGVSPTSPPFQATSPAYQPNTPQGISPTTPPFQVTSPAYQPRTPQEIVPTSPIYQPTSPPLDGESPTYQPTSPPMSGGNRDDLLILGVEEMPEIKLDKNDKIENNEDSGIRKKIIIN